MGCTTNVHVRVATSKRLFDVAYSLDNLNRVRGADEGGTEGTAPGLTIESGTRTRKETWPDLSLTGNWTSRLLDQDGDGNVTDPLDRNEPSGDQAFNDANEWTGRHLEKAGGLDRTFEYTYDAVGNLIGEYEEDDLGGTVLLNQRGYVYDAFGRMVAVTGLPGEEVTYIEKHRYNGLGFRTMWQYDVDVDGTLEDPERYYFMHDERWRVIGTFRNQDAHPKESFVHHAAGQSGFGGASYIDSILLRDRDNYTSTTPNPMSSAGDGTLEERRYYCQNWRADVVALTKSDGTPLEYVRYSSYGEPTVYPVADLDMDGDVDATDATEMDNLYGGVPVNSAYADADINFDGNADTGDLDSFNESYTANTGLSGKGRLSSPSVGNRLGYAGYHHDPVTRLYDVRHRWYFPEIGRWGRRDPVGYVEGVALYQYVSSMAVVHVDALGLIGTPCQDRRQNPDHPIETNGCGAGILTPLIPERPFFIINFSPCCDSHDSKYDSCGNGTNELGALADQLFCSCLDAQCAAAYPTLRPGYFSCYRLARIYCRAVVKYGPGFYPEVQKKACICCDAPNPDPRCSKAVPRNDPSVPTLEPSTVCIE